MSLPKVLTAKVATSYLKNDNVSNYFEPFYNYTAPGETEKQSMYTGYGKNI